MIMNRGRLGTENKDTPKASVNPSLYDLSWAAGFLEGEGCFKIGGWHTQQVGASQVNREPLEKLHRMFGGKIHPYASKNVRENGYNRKSGYSWIVSGMRARGVMMTLFSFLSQKRKGSIRRALSI
jgi:hypothetical protein